MSPGLLPEEPTPKQYRNVLNTTIIISLWRTAMEARGYPEYVYLTSREMNRWLINFCNLLGLYNKYALNGRIEPWSADARAVSVQINAVLAGYWNETTKEDARDPKDTGAYQRLASAIVNVTAKPDNETVNLPTWERQEYEEKDPYVPPEDVVADEDDDAVPDVGLESQLTSKIIDFIDANVPSAVQTAISAIPLLDSYKKLRRSLAETIANHIVANQPKSAAGVAARLADVAFTLGSVDVSDYFSGLGGIIWDFLKDKASWLKKKVEDALPDDDEAPPADGEPPPAPPAAGFSDMFGLSGFGLGAMDGMLWSIAKIGIIVFAVGAAAYLGYMCFLEPKMRERQLERRRETMELSIQMAKQTQAMSLGQSKVNLKQVGEFVQENPELVQLGTTVGLAAATGGTSLAVPAVAGAVTQAIPQQAPTTVPMTTQPNVTEVTVNPS